MRYAILKRIINCVYNIVYRTHIEIENDEIIKRLGNIGKESWIEYPSKVARPEHVFIGENVKILSNSRLDCYEVDGKIGRISIGDGSYIGYNASFLAGEDIYVGKNVLFASNIMICSENHGKNPENENDYMHQPITGKIISIGDGCWLGEKAIILSGVSVGKKSIIGAGAVVTHDIPDYSIAVGSPAEVIGRYNLEKHKWEKVSNCGENESDRNAEFN